MPLLTDLLINRCSIKRLQGFGGYDFSVSSEGEVVETWTTISSNVPCLLNRVASPTERTTAGMVERSSPTIFFDKDVDVEDGDILVIDSKQYKTSDVQLYSSLFHDFYKTVDTVFIGEDVS